MVAPQRGHVERAGTAATSFAERRLLVLIRPIFLLGTAMSNYPFLLKQGAVLPACRRCRPCLTQRFIPSQCSIRTKRDNSTASPICVGSSTVGGIFAITAIQPQPTGERRVNGGRRSVHLSGHGSAQGDGVVLGCVNGGRRSVHLSGHSRTDGHSSVPRSRQNCPVSVGLYSICQRIPGRSCH